MISSSFGSSSVFSGSLGCTTVDCRAEAINTLNVDLWINILKVKGEHSLINDLIPAFLTQVQAKAAYGKGGILILESLERAGSFPTNHPHLYNCLVRFYASLGDAAAIQKIRDLSAGDEEWINEEGRRYLDKMPQLLLDDIKTETLPDGSVAIGAFQGDLLNGPGRVTSPNGKIREGIFKDGLLEGWGIITADNIHYSTYSQILPTSRAAFYGCFTRGCFFEGGWILTNGRYYELS